jgi:hypothetical protein
VNPLLLDPGAYAIGEAAYGHDQVVDTFVLSPGDVRGTRSSTTAFSSAAGP